MAETLIVYNPEIDIGSKLLSCDARVHRFVTPVIVSGNEELFPEVVYSCVFFVKPGTPIFVNSCKADGDETLT
jgi:hypothetical protein